MEPAWSTWTGQVVRPTHAPLSAKATPIGVRDLHPCVLEGSSPFPPPKDAPRGGLLCTYLAAERPIRQSSLHFGPIKKKEKLEGVGKEITAPNLAADRLQFLEASLCEERVSSSTGTFICPLNIEQLPVTLFGSGGFLEGGLEDPLLGVSPSTLAPQPLKCQ